MNDSFSFLDKHHPSFWGTETVASLFSIMGWNPAEKLGQRAGDGRINNKNAAL